MMKDKLNLAKIQGHLESLEGLFAMWGQNEIDSERFSASATIELLGAKKGISALISKAME